MPIAAGRTYAHGLTGHPFCVEREQGDVAFVSGGEVEAERLDRLRLWLHQTFALAPS